MALIVEDGTNVTDANGYSSVADAQTYYDDNGYTFTATEDTVILGSRTSDALYRTVLKGAKTAGVTNQSLAWPRLNMFDEDGYSIPSGVIPELWKHAVWEAGRAVPEDQSIDFGTFIKRVEAGSVEVEFQGGKQSRTLISFMDELVAPFIGGGGQRFVRA